MGNAIQSMMKVSNRFCKMSKKLISLVLAFIMMYSSIIYVHAKDANLEVQKSIKLEIPEMESVEKSIVRYGNPEPLFTSLKANIAGDNILSEKQDFEFGTMVSAKVAADLKSNGIKAAAPLEEVTYEITDIQMITNDDNDLNLSDSVTQIKNPNITSPSGISTNTFGKSKIMAAPAPAPTKPDYYAGDITSVGNYPFEALAIATFNVKFGNSGTTAPTGTNVRGIIIVDDTRLMGPISLGNVPANTSWSFNIEMRGLGDGNHTVEFKINDNNAAAESNTANNSNKKTFNWVGVPDLTISSINCVTNSPIVGEPVNFSFVMENIGNGKATKPIHIGITLGDKFLGNILYNGLLPAGHSVSGTINLTFNKKSTYTLSVKADALGVIAEKNENNNVKELPFSDLTIPQSVTVSGKLCYDVYEKAGKNPIVTNAKVPLSNYPILICDEKIKGDDPNSSDPATHIRVSTTTDSSGNFSKTVPYNDANVGNDISILVPMENSYVKICRMDDTRTAALPSHVYLDYQRSTLNFGEIYLGGNVEGSGVMNIYHWIKEGKEFYNNIADSGSLDVVKVKWSPEQSHENGSCFVKAENTIYLDGISSAYGADQYDDDVILHEYGHYIMAVNERNPNPWTSGGDHDVLNPSLGDTGTTQDSTAYSEAYASFIATQAKNNSQYRNYGTIDNFIFHGFDVDTRKRLNNDGNKYIPLATEVPRQDTFYHNARMELFTGGAMHDLANKDGFNRVNDVVMSDRLETSIEFYDTFMDTVSDSNKKAYWDIFNESHSAFDYDVPTISDMKQEGNIISANILDDVSVETIEWLEKDVGSIVTGKSKTLTIPDNLSPGKHTIIVRAFDPEGLARGEFSREDINGNELRKKACSEEMLEIIVPSKKASIKNSSKVNFVYPVFEKIPEELAKQNFISDDVFVMSNIGVGSSLEGATVNKTQQLTPTRRESLKAQSDIIEIKNDNTDLYITGMAFNSIDGFDIIDINGKKAASIDAVWGDSYTVVSDLPIGNYSLKIRHTADLSKKSVNPVIPYWAVVFAVPGMPELNLPKELNKDNIEVNNPYSDSMVIGLNEKAYNINPKSSVTIPLSQGDNKITYYVERDGDRSEIVTENIFVDSIAPVVTVDEVKLMKWYDKEWINVFGTVNENGVTLKINGQRTYTEGLLMNGNMPSFGASLFTPDIDTIYIEAEDELGNIFTNQIKIVR